MRWCFSLNPFLSLQIPAWSQTLFTVSVVCPIIIQNIKEKKKGINNLFILFIICLQQYNPIMPQFKYTNISQNIHSQSNFNIIQNIILLCNIPHLTTISAFSISNLVYLVIIYFYPLFKLILCYQQTCTNHVEYNMQSVLGRYILTLGAAQFTTERTEILNALFTRKKQTPWPILHLRKRVHFLYQNQTSPLIINTVGWLQETLHKIYASCSEMYQTKAHFQCNVNRFSFMGISSFWAPLVHTGPNHKIHALPIAKETPINSSAWFARAQSTEISTLPLNSNI